MRAEAKKPIKSRKTGAKLYASTASKPLVALLSSASANQHFKLVQRCSKAPKNCGFSGLFYFASSVAVYLVLAGFELF